VDLPTDLASYLGDLVENIGTGTVSSLTDSLTALAVDLQTAVSSYLGLRLTVVLDGWPVTLTAFGGIHGARPTTSFRLVLSSMGPGFDPESRIVFYASTPGAFVDLAADLAYLQRVRGLEDTGYAAEGNRRGRRPAVALDADLPPASVVSGLAGMGEYATINRAVGMLIEQGHHPDHAHAVLRRAAAVDGLGLPDYAARLLGY
jgi:hypothetical protein